MTIEKLTPIILLGNEKMIDTELKRLGYTDCERNKQYKHISLTDLFDGDLQDTETFPDKKGKRTYEGAIITGVKRYKNLEFVVVNINDNKHAFPIKMRIFVKENEQRMEFIVARIGFSAALFCQHVEKYAKTAVAMLEKYA